MNNKIDKNNYKNYFKVSMKPGFTIIEALVTLFIFSLITMTFYSIFSLGGSYIIESKNRLGAVALANEKMEIIRNLKYDDIGIVGGIPSGSIVAEEDVAESKHTYHVKTFIQYIDDPFDGVSPDDLNSSDYKRVKVTISWKGVKGADSSFFLVARFVPPGIEQNSTGGILSVNVIGSNGIGVPQASVYITNTDVNPYINMTTLTDDSGNLMLPGAPQSTQGYHMHISKNGYETVDTIDPDTVTYSVVDVPASVVDGMLNTQSFVENGLVDLKIITVDALENPLPNIDFYLEGGRILGTDQITFLNQYNLISDSMTDASGEKTFSDISPGQFLVSNIGTAQGYTKIGMDAFSKFDVVKNEYTLPTIAPGESREAKIRFASNDNDSLLLNVVKATDDAPIDGAIVTLTSASGYSENITTSLDGVAFFPIAVNPLAAGLYTITVMASGYGDYSGTIDINKLTAQQIKLTAN